MSTCTLQRKSRRATFNHDYKDEISRRYQIILDALPTSEIDVLVAGQTHGPHPLPVRRQLLSTGGILLMCASIAVSPADEREDVWYADVQFSPLPEGEDEEQQNENPLARPPIFNIEYIEGEYVIDKAKNVEALSHGNGAGANRAADTLGPIVNGAGKRPDEPIVDVDRNAVLIVQRNYSSLGVIADLNEAFQRTTNSDTVTLGSSTIAVRRLKYLLTDSQGQQIENGVKYYPGVTRVELKKTTDLILDNVGYDVWDTTAAKVIRHKVDGEFPAEPINLNLDGTSGGTNTTTITYRHLTETAYASLFA
jgi:hypothetical protein